jgi:hypothetical protein
MDYETFREERRISNKLTKEYLRGQKDPQQGKHSTRYNLIKQAYKHAKNGWSELAPNREKLLGLLEQIKENERRKDTPGNDIQPGGNGSESVSVGDAKPVATKGTREGLPADEFPTHTQP